MPGYLPKPPVCILNRAHPLARGLVAAWPFDEGGGGKAVRDAVGSNHGMAAAYNKWTGGAFGHCLTFNGTSDYVSVGSSSALDQPKTFSFWYTTSTYQIGMTISRGSDNYEVYTHTSDNKWTMYLGNAYSYTNVPLRLNTWTLLTIVVGGTTITTYENGGWYSTTTIVGTPSYANAGTLYIGTREGAFRFDGSMDDVRLYNRALSAAEVAAVYADPWAIYRPSRGWLKVAGLVVMGAWWHRNMIRDRRSGVR